MRSLLLVFGFALGTLTPILVAQDPPKSEKGDQKAAKKYVSEEGKYKVAFPGKPVLKEQKAPIRTGEMTVYTAIVQGDDSAFMVCWNEMPKGSKNVDPKKILDGTVKGLVQDGRLVSSRDVEFGLTKMPARAAIVDTKVGMRFRVLVILKDERLYQVLVAGTKELVASKEANDFVKSMEITGDEK